MVKMKMNSFGKMRNIFNYNIDFLIKKNIKTFKHNPTSKAIVQFL